MPINKILLAALLSGSTAFALAYPGTHETLRTGTTGFPADTIPHKTARKKTAVTPFYDSFGKPTHGDTASAPPSAKPKPKSNISRGNMPYDSLGKMNKKDTTR